MANGITETIGLDMGDRYTRYCVLDHASGEEVGSGRVRTTPTHMEGFLQSHPQARVVLEAGTHSRWTNDIAETYCTEVLVANPRKLSFIYQNDRKSDEVDAELLARVGRIDPKMLHPIRHRSMSAQSDLAILRARAGVVSARTKLVNTLRGIVKSFGWRIPPHASKRIGSKTLAFVPEDLQPALGPLLLAIEALTDEIAEYDRKVDDLADEKYPESRRFTQVFGVGNLTAMAYMLTLEDPDRFRNSRSVGAFLGLVPRRDQSGEDEKELSISKAGDRMVRTLLVQCAHRILSRNGPDSDLRRAGERIASKGGRTAKRRAVIAVARKLAVLLHALWQTGETYEPLRNNQVQAA
jgi:transposase